VRKLEEKRGEKIMKERTVTHGTFVIERSYPVTPQRVFAAFSDPVKKQRWFADPDEAPVEEFQMDFRVGGKELKRFKVQIGFICTNNTVYLDIVPNSRIVFAYTMSAGDRRFSPSQATVEMVTTEKGTDLIFTEQGAYFEGSDGPQMREGGWRQLLNQLEGELAS
jgi:uncharacterized protein YndB with AHSA1/START domain